MDLVNEPAAERHARRTGEHVLVVGCGYVGEVLARRLAATGHRVTGLRRSAVDPVPGVEVRRVDVLERDQRSDIPDDADVVVVALSPSGSEVERYRAAFVAAPALVVAHQRTPPRLVVMTTSTAVYGQDDGSWVDEDSPADPATATGEVLREAEVALAGLGVPAVSLRLGGIYGPGRDRLVRDTIEGRASCRPDRWTNRIHRDDAASAIEAVIAAGAPVPGLCNVVDDAPALQCEVLRWLAVRLDAPPPTIHDAVDAVTSRREVTSKRVANGRLRSLGWRPEHPSWREGYEAILAESGHL